MPRMESSARTRERRALRTASRRSMRAEGTTGAEPALAVRLGGRKGLVVFERHHLGLAHEQAREALDVAGLVGGHLGGERSHRFVLLVFGHVGVEGLGATLGGDREL